MIQTITSERIWAGRTGNDPTWFHPRACRLPTDDGPAALMTLQQIHGSDIFGPVHWTRTDDLGKSWRDPEPIPALGRRELGGGLVEGICDVVPELHEPSGKVLALGHNVYYLDGKLTKPESERFPVYAVGDADGNWSERRRLEWDDPRASAMYTANCGQWVTLDDGDILLPVCFMPKGRKDRAAGTLRCSFDGETLTVKAATENELRNTTKRGLLEPSVVWFKGIYYLTMRAEDGHGYVAVSRDGLEWRNLKRWAFEGRDRLEMSSTQQHWLVHSDALYLVYTRKDELNEQVFRWRSPVYMARVEIQRCCLLRESEHVVLPLTSGDEPATSDEPRLGNFHVTNMTSKESWVTAGEVTPAWQGDTRLGRIRWRLPNRGL